MGGEGGQFLILLIERSQAGAIQALPFSNDDGEVNENGKNAIGLDWQNNSSALESRFFSAFLCRIKQHGV